MLAMCVDETVALATLRWSSLSPWVLGPELAGGSHLPRGYRPHLPWAELAGGWPGCSASGHRESGTAAPQLLPGITTQGKQMQGGRKIRRLKIVLTRRSRLSLT
jgi:hypothetical protein